MVSVLILTHNEARDLPACLASIVWSDDIHIVDSHSTDTTASIALDAGAHVHPRTFDNYAAQRNFGLQLPFKHEWLLILDADERTTATLSAEIQRIVKDILVSGDATVSAFRIRRRDFLFNTWLRHAQLSPFYVRLVRHARVRYTRAINEVLEVDGTIADLAAPLDHFPFSKGVAHWVDRHNRYSTMEAALIHAQSGLQNPSLLTALRHPDFHTRRLHQKALYYKLPLRPLIKWVYLVLLRGAVLDGPAGLAYATLASFYEYLIVIKTKELRSSNRIPRTN